MRRTEYLKYILQKGGMSREDMNLCKDFTMDGDWIYFFKAQQYMRANSKTFTLENASHNIYTLYDCGTFNSRTGAKTDPLIIGYTMYDPLIPEKHYLYSDSACTSVLETTQCCDHIVDHNGKQAQVNRLIDSKLLNGIIQFGANCNIENPAGCGAYNDNEAFYQSEQYYQNAYGSGSNLQGTEMG